MDTFKGFSIISCFGWSRAAPSQRCRPFTSGFLSCGRPSDCFLLCVQLMMILIKVSDISNEARPMEVAEPWLDCLLQEFYNQVAERSCTERLWQTGRYSEDRSHISFSGNNAN